MDLEKKVRAAIVLNSVIMSVSDEGHVEILEYRRWMSPTKGTWLHRFSLPNHKVEFHSHVANLGENEIQQAVDRLSRVLVV